MMTRISLFSSPLLLGFDRFEQLLEQVSKAGDGFPPYNIERSVQAESGAELWQITLALAGFSAAELDVTVEGKQLMVKGQQREEGKRDFVHRGIAGRAFARSFILADGMEVARAALENGLLMILLKRQGPESLVKRIPIEEL